MHKMLAQSLNVNNMMYTETFQVESGANFYVIKFKSL